MRATTHTVVVVFLFVAIGSQLSQTVGAADAKQSSGGDIPAFPGAEGFGSTTVGGRGGRVVLVTNTKDYGRREKPIPGSLRAAVQAKGPRIVVFQTGGLIELKEELRVTEPYLTIAGQTAPGDGICLKQYHLGVRDTHDVVIRHLRVRPGDGAKKELDGLYVYQSQNVVIDHCSVSWSSDETLSVTGEGCTNVTVQWCVISESLNRSVHDKGEHGYGSLLRTDGDITFHHNLYAHHKTRCPRPGTYGKPRGILLDFRNNAIYNWISPAGYSAEDPVRMNYVGNYLKPGPSTKDTRYAFKVGGEATTLYAADNHFEGRAESNRNNLSLISHPERGRVVEQSFETANVTTQTAGEAFERILTEAGATLPRRDAVDTRVVQTVATGGGRVIDTPGDVGGWPKYNSGNAPQDSDVDGMPDAWEKQHGLNANDAADGNLDADGDGYTNVEEFLNSTDPRTPKN